METLGELIRELTSNDKMMWVIGGGEVASENTSNGIKEPDLSNGWWTIEADNWHFHLAEASVNGIQFVEAESHGGLKSFYVRFSRDWEGNAGQVLLSQPLPGRRQQPHRLPGGEVRRLPGDEGQVRGS